MFGRQTIENQMVKAKNVRNNLLDSAAGLSHSAGSGSTVKMFYKADAVV